MKRAGITEAKNGFSALVDSVQACSSVLIVDRGRPVARLEPVAGPARRPTTLEFVTLDERLAAAARVEGFSVND